MKNTLESGYYQLYRAEMIPLLPNHYSHVLEVGCGAGNFRQNVSPEAEYWGIEPAADAAKVAAEKLDKVLTGTYQAVADQLPDDYFDVVICNDVIEHMVDHDEFFQAIQKKLKHNGYLVASIPNIRYISFLYDLLVDRDWEYLDAGTLDKTHLRFFTEKSLLRTIRQHGYVIDQFGGINPYGSFNSRNLFMRGLSRVVSLFLGADVIWSQFGFRVRCVKAESQERPVATKSEQVTA